MANLSLTAAAIRPLDGSICVPVQLGGTVTPGDSVYISTYDGTIPVVARSDANASQATARARGLIVAIQGGKSTGASGNAATMCVFGPVAGFASLTANAYGYVSNDAGKLEDAAGSYATIMGYAQSPTVFFVDIQHNAAASS